MGRFSRIPLFLLPVLVFSMLQRPTFAVKKSYVVYLGSHSHGREITQTQIDLAEKSHYEFLSDFVGSPEAAKDSIFYCYTKHINGFAATLDVDKVDEIAKHPNVISVFPNEAVKLHTTRSWDFLDLEKNGTVLPGSIWEKARFGEDTIIGNLDTGMLSAYLVLALQPMGGLAFEGMQVFFIGGRREIDTTPSVWPESKSFSDDGYGPIPLKWKGGCTDIGPGSVHCNRKLIGAKAFNKGYLSAVGQTFNTTRGDLDGHGTHTLSTAAGNVVQNASIFGFGQGTAKGGSPKARVASYKVCGKPVRAGSCFNADIMAAFDSAIHDGVDILSVSIGSGPSNYLTDPIAIGSFHAVKNGILVVASAGNDGPEDGKVSNVAPWLLTVGANTMDRQFSTFVKLGNNKTLKGQSLSQVSMPPNEKMYPLVSGYAAATNGALADDAQLCKEGTLDPVLVKGKIVVCISGENNGADKGSQALKAGAVGVIVISDADVLPETNFLPASYLSHADGNVLLEYIKSTKEPTAYITPVTTELGTKPAPSMADFSSQGPNSVTPEILKPDITAPGVNILAAYSEAMGPSELPYDTRRVPFNIMSGTSMSCPHVAGVAGLLKTLYPHWSPAAIKSAIMTTARTRDNVGQPMLNSTNQKATPFSFGAGEVRPNSAMDPGLVYDLTPVDHLNFLCTIGYNQTTINIFSEQPYICPKPAISLLDFNHPSITVPNLSGSVSVTRKLKNVGSSPATYKAEIRPPLGIAVLVEPANLTFDSVGQEKTFKLTIKTDKPDSAKDYVFGELKWFDGRHQVKSPIVVKAAET